MKLILNPLFVNGCDVSSQFPICAEKNKHGVFLFSGLSKIVKLPRKSKADIMIRAKEQIEKLTEVSSELQRQLHMEMSRNQQLKNELERCQQPPIKLKIQHGKSVLPDD